MHRLYGHDALKNRLGLAIRSGRFPQAALLKGPRGIGKQRLGLWLAQAVFCERQEASPCDECGPCRQVGRLTHPDLHWFVPLVLKQRVSDADKMVENAERGLADVLDERREQPLYGPPDQTASHSLASVRLLQRRVAMKPFQGRRKFVLVGDAERLVVQESSPEAANAMLKVLEEPPEDTTIVLTAESDHGLLPTIRSRLVPIRVAPVGPESVRDFLRDELHIASRDLDRGVERADGRIGRAVGESGDTDAAERAATAFLAAVKKGAPGWTVAALAQAPWGARGGFTAMLDAVAQRLRRQLRDRGVTDHRTAHRLLGALEAVERHRGIAQGNVNPQLGLAVLAGELELLR